MYDGFHNYQSPFDTRYPDRWHAPDDPHVIWVKSRDAYAKSGSEHYFDLMLRCVTMDNPPSAPAKATRPKRNLLPSFNDSIFISLVIVWVVFAITMIFQVI